MQGYDAWLEAPYVDAAREQADFEKWVEINMPEIDLEDEQESAEAWERFEDAKYGEEE